LSEYSELYASPEKLVAICFRGTADEIATGETLRLREDGPIGGGIIKIIPNSGAI
jgi:hypothetical protein